jgi:dihydrodipicolinate synthase/N-acetylneuraminate lyase
MFYVENELVYFKEETDTYTVTQFIGMKKQYIIIDTETSTIYQWMEWGGDTYVQDTENITPILINGIEYIPINGKVEMQK